MSPSHSFARSYVTSVDIDSGTVSGPSDIALVPMPHRAHVIIRLHGHPIGDMSAPISVDTDFVSLARTYAWQNLQTEMALHLNDDGLPLPTSEADVTKITRKCARPLNQVTGDALKITVALATVGNEAACLRTIERVLQSSYPNFEIVVVDNTPGSTTLGQSIAGRYDPDKVRFVHETRKGLSFARNRGADEATGEIVVFTDDDVITDPGWLFAIAHGFQRESNVACVTGCILAAEIETPAQAWLEQYGGYNKGYRTEIYDMKHYRRKSALYPYDSGRFGSGANIAMRVDVLKKLGGFAVDLGAGTPAHGGEDLDLLRRVVTGNYQLVYEPSALLWHFHRRSYFALRRQMYRYGVGFGATVTKWMLQPSVAMAMLRRLPAGIRHVFSSTSTKNINKHLDYPNQLTWLERAGILAGPFLYLKSRSVVARRK